MNHIHLFIFWRIIINAGQNNTSTCLWFFCCCIQLEKSLNSLIPFESFWLSEILIPVKVRWCAHTSFITLFRSLHNFFLYGYLDIRKNCNNIPKMILLMIKERDNKSKFYFKYMRFLIQFMKNCGMRFTTIVTDLTNISSALTHLPSLGLEGFTQCLPRNLYNNH